MKLYNIIRTGLSIFLIGGFTASCDDFLDIVPRGQDVATSMKHYNGLLNDLTWHTIGEQFQFASDEYIGNPNILAAYGTIFRNIYDYEPQLYTADESNVFWKDIASMIYTQNVVIREVMDADDGTEAEKREVWAEAKAGRAYNHFLLAQLYGQPYNAETAETDLAIPLIKEPRIEGVDYQRSTNKECYRWIIAELEEACPKLAEKSSHVRRIYKCAGYTMLGKVYWMTGDYENAVRCLKIAKEWMLKDKRVILYDYNTQLQEWGFDLNNPRTLWQQNPIYPQPKDNLEAIYLKRYDISMQTTVFATMYYGGAGVLVKDELFDLFSPNDLRRHMFTRLGMNESMEGFEHNFFGFISYVNLAPSTPDLYLMLAESEARIGELNEAKHDLQTFREHRMPKEDAVIPIDVNDQNKLLRFCVEERIREYLGTGYRFFDLRRLWNDPLFPEIKANASHIIDGKVTPMPYERLTFRIPPIVMQFHTNWQDN